MFETLTRQIGEVRSALAECPRDLSDAERIDLIRALEELKCTAAAAQATSVVDLDKSQRALQVAAGLRPDRLGEGIAEQVGLARRESPHKGARLLGLAKVLEREMPHTLALMRDGRLNEWRATILARETACLTADDRATVDLRLCADGEAATMSDLGLARAAKKLACELDVAAVAARARRVESERHVSIRPAPDTMCWVTALLPVTQAVRAYAVLLAAATAARAQGDERTKGQVMADSLVERVTGTSASEPPRVEVKLVMTDRSLLVGADDAAHLVGLDSRARLAPAGLAEFIETRDEDLCRTPWCGAPIRHRDHAKAWCDALARRRGGYPFPMSRSRVPSGSSRAPMRSPDSSWRGGWSRGKPSVDSASPAPRQTR